MKRKMKSSSAISHANHSNNPYRPDPHKGKGNLRSKATIKRINMYRDKPDMEKMKKLPDDPSAGRVEPDRRWFGNTRSLDQKQLHDYMKSLEEKSKQKGSGHSILIQG